VAEEQDKYWGMSNRRNADGREIKLEKEQRILCIFFHFSDG
jgi:hypothetical protein